MKMAQNVPFVYFVVQMAVAGKSFKEAVNALIYRIDLVYLRSNGIYELRTPKIDIHRQVHKQ